MKGYNTRGVLGESVERSRRGQTAPGRGRGRDIHRHASDASIAVGEGKVIEADVDEREVCGRHVEEASEMQRQIGRRAKQCST